MIRKAFYWSASAQLVTVIFTFGSSLILARLLTPREMGVYAVSVATIGILQVFATFGVGAYVIRATELDEHVVDTAFTLNALICAMLAAGVFGLSHAGARFLSDPGVAHVLRLLAIMPLLSAIDFRQSIMLQRGISFQSISVVAIAAAIVNAGVTVTAAWAGASYMSQVYGGLLSGAVNTVGLLIVGRRFVSLRTSLVGARAMLAFGVRVMSIGGVSALAARLSDIILGRLLGLGALGLFGRASSLNMLIFTNVYGTMTRVVFVKRSADYRERGRLRESFLKWLAVIAGVMGPVLLGLAVLAGPVILLLYGERWLDAAAPLSLLLVAQFITLRYAMNWEVFVIRDELNIQTRFEVSRSVFTLGTRAVGCLFGLVGAAAAAIVDGVFAVFLYGRQIDRLIEAERGDLSRVTTQTIALSLAAIAPAGALMLWTRWDPRTPLPLVFASVALGVVLWLTVLARLRHPLFDEIRAIVLQARARLRPAARG